jgi:NAD(P)-dependent dehydrogenase (short-subunit alcohol dehydrogenase family)
MDYRDRHVVITGGTGALGTAVVSALLAAGAVCHVPYIDEQKAQRYPHRGNERVKLIAGCDLADEAGVARVFDGIDDLWASIHIAGGFAMSPLAETDKAGLMAMIDTNLVTCYLSLPKISSANEIVRNGQTARVSTALPPRPATWFALRRSGW